MLIQLFTSILLASVHAFDYTIGVGLDEISAVPGIGFDPSRTVTPRNGDTLVFRVLAGEHMVVQTSFASPCSPLPNGFATPLLMIANGTTENSTTSVFRFGIVNSSQPLFFADLALSNCITGAVLCINTNETTGSLQTCDAFKAAAIAQGGALRSAYTASAYSGLSLSSTTSASTRQATATTSAPPPVFSKASAAMSSSVSAGLVGIIGIVGVIYSHF